MSGFEIVGVVLGSIPLLISGLEHYRDGLEAIKIMWQYEERIEDLVTTFIASTAKYRLTCENLLVPIMLPDNDYTELLNNPNGEIWKDKELGEHIRRRLGDSHRAYSRLVARLQIALLKFASKLGLDPDNDMKPLWVDKNQDVESKNLERFFKKSNRLWMSVKLAFDNDKMNKLLEQIERDVSRIDNLTEGNVKLEPLRQERRRKSNTLHWQNIRDHAKLLFDAISSHRLWDCEHEHKASLKLEVRGICDHEHSSRPRFSLMFSFDDVAVSTVSTPWDWRAVEIEPIEVSTHMSRNTVGGQTRSVSFASVAPSLARSQSQNKMAVSTSKILNLCNALRQEQREICCIGFLDDQTWQHYIYATNQRSCKQEISEFVSLHQYLGCNMAGLAAKQGGLSVKERYNLSLILASTLIQLSRTPWLDESWGLGDIHVLSRNDNTFVTEGTYVSRKFATKSSCTDDKKTQSRSWIQNKTVFAFGVLLIELSFGQRLHIYKTAKDVDGQGNDTVFTEYLIATRLVQELASREALKYAEAAKRCIFFNSETTNADIENPNFQEQFHRDVIMPLQELCDLLL